MQRKALRARVPHRGDPRQLLIVRQELHLFKGTRVAITQKLCQRPTSAIRLFHEPPDVLVEVHCLRRRRRLLFCPTDRHIAGDVQISEELPEDLTAVLEVVHEHGVDAFRWNSVGNEL